MKTLNLSNHVMSTEQVKDLESNWEATEVIELPENLKRSWGQMSPSNYKNICDDIITYIQDNNIEILHIAGMMPAVVYIIGKLIESHPWMRFLSAYSERVSEEVVKEDGTIEKRTIFKHQYFFEYPTYLFL